MNDTTMKLLNLINEGKTVNEISEILKLSNKAIFCRLNMLRNAGYNFKRLYYSDGNIVYSNGADMAWYNEKNNGVNLITKDNKIDAIVISDIHFGSKYEIEGIMDRIYNYCISNGIHIILFGGDLVDGTFGNVKRIDNIDEQLAYIMKKYPFDKSIINFGVLGDHDYSIFKANSRDISLLFSNYRHDIVPLGYYIGKLNIGNDILTFWHGSKKNYLSKKKNDVIPSNDITSRRVALLGHLRNSFSIVNYGSNTLIKLPSLSGLRDDDEFLPSAIRIRISLNNDIFSHILVNQLLIGEKIYSINEFNQDFASSKKQDYRKLLGKISYNEVYKSSDFIDTDEDNFEEEIDIFDKTDEEVNTKVLTKKL
ncbi:MAG: metallophosphoesterase [Bacilli bacterium]|nr:metallophosphoesterase [Bacilli bacterium]